MFFIRKLLFPFALIYWIVTAVRNFLFDRGWMKSTAFGVPVIAVGNLNVGGTGKTPHVEYLIRLLSVNYRVAVLSRGYKRKTTGFVLVDAAASAETIGDEPFQYYSKFKRIIVAVDADRTNGIKKLLKLEQKPQIILLDDAYQHRKVKAGFYVLLTSYNDLYTDDYLLPMGNLRESASGAKRADVIIVTKCPKNMTEEQRSGTVKKLRIRPNQLVCFSSTEYDSHVYSEKGQLSVDSIKGESKVLVGGIANPMPFFLHLQQQGDHVFEFPDHHNFSDEDIVKILKAAADKPIITTEKDYVRLKGKVQSPNLYYLPIRSRIIDNSNFDNKILDYVGKCAANS